MTIGRPESATGRRAEGRLVDIILRTGAPHSLVLCQRGEVIYSAGKREEVLYIVREGCIKIITYSAAGKPCIHGVEPPGSVFGELSFVGPVRPDTAIAMRRSLVLRVPLTPLLETDERQHVINGILLCLADRVRAQQYLLNSFVTLDSEHRLAVVLLHLARHLGRRRGRELRIEERFSQEDLAAMVGTTRSRIGSFLKSFRTEGLISADGSALVLDEARMAQFALGYNDNPSDEQGLFTASFGHVPARTRLPPEFRQGGRLSAAR